jgi:glycosyltransferase involved in cell wall biosynthesis
MRMPCFTVVIPVYNRAASLGLAIESVRSQTFQDFEVIVVDDGSSDNPRAVVDDFSDSRLRYIRQPNKGGGAARNTGIDEARGRFVAFLDSDDLFLPHHLADMWTLLKDSKDVVGYAPVWVDRGQGSRFLKPPRGIRPTEEMGDYLFCDRGFTPTITTVLPREQARRVRYNEDLRMLEDSDFAIRLSWAGCRFEMLEKPGAVWKDSSDPNRTSFITGTERLEAWLERMKPLLSSRAYYGARGWPYAKRVAKTRPWAALKLYLNAVRRGCYRPSLAGVVFLQIFLGGAFYRGLANWLLSYLPIALRTPVTNGNPASHAVRLSP